MKNKWNFCLLATALFLNSGCFSVGGAGSITSFTYNVDKKTLQQAVDAIVYYNKKIKKDTKANYTIDQTYGKNDTIMNNRYNDGENYLSFFILDSATNRYYSFVIHYFGDKAYWDTAKISNVAIIYAWDDKGNGGSEGDGGISWRHPFLKRKVIDLFEKTIIHPVNQALRMDNTHED